MEIDQTTKTTRGYFFFSLVPMNSCCGIPVRDAHFNGTFEKLIKLSAPANKLTKMSSVVFGGFVKDFNIRFSKKLTVPFKSLNQKVISWYDQTTYGVSNNLIVLNCIYFLISLISFFCHPFTNNVDKYRNLSIELHPLQFLAQLAQLATQKILARVKDICFFQNLFFLFFLHSFFLIAHYRNLNNIKIFLQ